MTADARTQARFRAFGSAVTHASASQAASTQTFHRLQDPGFSARIAGSRTKPKRRDANQEAQHGNQDQGILKLESVTTLTGYR